MSHETNELAADALHVHRQGRTLSPRRPGEFAVTVVPNIEKLVHDGRALVGSTEAGEDVAGWPEVAYEAIRAINHLTVSGPIPAPTA